MYYFIYDSSAQSQENAKELARIENRLLDFGIKDKIVKTSALKSVRDAVAEAYKQKFNTIITVGEDGLFLSASEYLIGYPIALGTIPLGKHTLIASLLGMPYGAAACDLISARKLSEIPVARIDEHFFINSCTLSGVTTMEIDGSYTIETPNNSIVTVTNVANTTNQTQHPIKAGYLSVLISKQKTGFLSKKREKNSILFVKSLSITASKQLSVSIDGQQPSLSCSTISVHNKPLICVVGKNSVT